MKGQNIFNLFNRTVVYMLGFAFIFYSCSKDSPAPPKPTTDIYTAGNVLISGTWYPAYWKNGKLTVLDQTHGGYVYAIAVAVSGKDTTVYAAGYVNPNSKQVLIWKNGIPSPLTDGIHNANVNSILVVGTDVYVSGWLQNSNGHNVATLWKNSTPTNLNDGNAIYARGYGISASGSTIATAFYESFTGNLIMWKNGVTTTLSTNGNGDVTYGDGSSNVFVDKNGDVYVAGYEYDNDNATDVATYWKNGVATHLATTYSYANSITVSDGDVYVLGFDYDANNKEVLRMWKNGVISTLPTGNILNLDAYNIAVAHGNVYTSCDMNTVDNNNINYWSSQLFKDGVLVAPYDGTSQSIYAPKMVVLHN